MRRRKRTQDPRARLIKTVLTDQLRESADQHREDEERATESKKLRDERIRFAKACGLSLADIADIAHMSRARVQQIAPGRPSAADREAATEMLLSQIATAIGPTRS